MRGILGRLGAVMALGVLAVCVFVASRWLAHKGLVWAANVTTIAAFVLAIATVMVPVLRKLLGKLAGAPPLARMTLPEARADYADALDKQWAREEQLRRVYDPWPLPVRWRRGDGHTRQFAGIKDTFTHLPTQRMVILGPAGAGKSVLAIKLVRDLLSSRKPGDRVPVLLSAATWTRDCTMTEWITEQLIRSQPNLDVRIRTGTGATIWLPKALAESGLIPVIDGLDELPPDRWAAVITEVNAFGSDYPLVLTQAWPNFRPRRPLGSFRRLSWSSLNRLRYPRSSSTSARPPTRPLTAGRACSTCWTPSRTACSPARSPPR